MLTNTKIAFRLVALLVLLLALMASLASLGLWGMSQVREGLRTVYEDRTVPTAQIGHIIDGYYRIRLSVLAATNAGDAAAAQKAAADIGALAGPIAETWKAYMATYLTPEEKVIADKTASAMADYDGVRGKVMEVLMAGDADGSRALAKAQGGPAFANLRDRLLELTQLQNDVARAEYDKASDVFDSKSLLLVSLTLAAVIGGALIAWAISRSITRPLRGIITVMQSLAAGDLATTVPGSERRDEVGEVAQSVLLFKEGLLETERLRSSQEASEKAALQQRRKEMLDLAATFEVSVGGVVGSVTAAATQLQSTAESLSKTAEETSQQSTAVAAASEQTTQNIQTVAAATEELTASINEISTQVAESTRIIGGAVTQANDTNAKVRTLAEAAQKIGDVVTLINTIASQTNLLALNATIEAARAGEAGKGFAVVASEVKNLATQTARATDDIGAQVRTIQDATSVSVGAISEIVVTINRVSEISTAIASAVEEQGAATQEISRNVQEASAGTAEVAANIAHVTRGSQSTSAGSSQVLGAAGELVANGNRLRAEVDGFLRTVRNV